jgi:CRP-like cAMP-binding protein
MAKTQRASGAYRNSLLNRLAAPLQEELISQFTFVALETRQVIYEAGAQIQDVYFVEAGLVSVVSVMADGGTIEVGTVGREGLVGSQVLLARTNVPYRHFVQIPGSANRIAAGRLLELADQHPGFREIILKYQAAFLTQLTQSAACNGLHTVPQRCCRWLLTSHDRVDSDTLPLTHEFLAFMLGVRRASVTEVLRPLQERGWIQSNRGEVTILDRAGLLSGSCECYGIVTDQYKQMLS